MALKLGTLSVTIGADTDRFDRNMRSVRRQLRQVGRQMRSGVNTAGRYSAGMAAAGVAIGTVLVKKQLAAIDATAKFSDRLNIQTQEMTALTHIAQLTGNSQQLLAKSMEAMARRVGQASQGFGQAERALEQLNLDAAELNELPLAEQFETISRELAKVETQNEKAAIAADLFSRQGISLINTMEMLAREGLAPTIDNLEKMGATFDRLDAAKVEQANDAMLRVQTALTGVFQRITIDLAPVITALANQFIGAAQASGGFAGVTTRAMGTATSAVAKVADVVNGLKVAWQAVKVVGVGAASAFVSAIEIAANVFASFHGRMVDGANALIEVFNMIPGGPKIPLMQKLEDSESFKAFQRMSDDLRNTVVAEVDKLHDMMMQPVPSEGVRKWFEDVQAQAAKLANEAANMQASFTPAGGGEQTDAVREQMQAQLDAFREKLMSEEEAEIAQHERRLEELQAFKEAELIKDQEFNALKEKEEKRHMEAIAAIDKQAMTDLEKFKRASFKSQANTVSNELKNMTASVARENKAMFEINRIAGIASATINTHEGITKALSAYPPPLSFAMAAAQAAAGFARVNAIKSQSFGGGGGGGAAPSLAGGTPAQPVSDVGGGGGGDTVNATIAVQGEAISKSQLRDLMGELSEQLKDGARLGNVVVE